MATLDVCVGIIGTGAMGASIACGLCSSGLVKSSAVRVCDLDFERVRALQDDYGMQAFASARDLVASRPDVIVLAVKPQVLFASLADLSSELKGQLVVSIAAGVRIAQLEAALPDVRLVRVMPNLPVSVRSGASAVAAGSRASQEDVELVRELFAALGSARIMREDQLDVAGILSGCGPAFFALFVDALVRAGVSAGLPAADGREMLLSTMRGVAVQLLESSEHPRSYMERVSSPGGTTIEALKAMESPLFWAVEDGVQAALKRTAELAGAKECSSDGMPPQMSVD